MLVDYHVHTKASPDGKGDLADFVSQARRKGIGEIGFSEHLLDQPVRATDFMHDHVKNFIEIKKHSLINVRLGAEIGFFPDELHKTRRFLAKYPFDYVIGSVHFIGNLPVDSSKNMQLYASNDITQVYEDYYALVKELCKSRLFDILGHADLVKIFGFKPSRDITSTLESTAKTIADCGLCVEVNTAGLARPCEEIYPSRQFLQVLKAHDVPVTLGSDAHIPEDVGRNFEKALELIKDAGYTRICTFEARKHRMARF